MDEWKRGYDPETGIHYIDTPNGVIRDESFDPPADEGHQSQRPPTFLGNGYFSQTMAAIGFAYGLLMIVIELVSGTKTGDVFIGGLIMLACFMIFMMGGEKRDKKHDELPR